MKAYLTRIDTPFVKRLATMLADKGYEILSEDDRSSEAIELFIAAENERLSGDDFDVRSNCGNFDYEVIMDSFHKNLFSPVLQLERLLPNLDKGKMKRICFLSSYTASMNLSESTKGFGYNMCKAALHTALTIFKNKLCNDGYTFRLYDPMETAGCLRVTTENAAYGALNYFLTRRAQEYTPSRDDEDRLVLRDALGREWPY